ncbi:hypothetical protein [Fastidiosibacter lacustris]|uniref:hypothetical protein n=1 Tax=Fastidiosibacter lacustris TaxID=2056695 RepID=UPI000E356D55|nr:hypothetical protein [Fastidiosibacter lacustris]
MKLKKIILYSFTIFGVTTLTSCGSTSDFFRNRDFDYARQPVEQNKPLEVPKSVSDNPNIHPALVVPEGQTSFTTNEFKQAQSALLPPNFGSGYNVSLIEQKQLYVVSTKLDYDKNNQAKLIIYEPYKLVWKIIEDALQNKVSTIVIEKTDKDNSRFVIKDKLSAKSYYVFIEPIKNEFRRAQLSLFEIDEKPATDKLSQQLVEAIDKAIKGQQVDEAMLINAQFGFINTNSGLKFQLYTDDTLASIVFVGDEQTINKTLKQAINNAGFKYIAYDEKQQTILIEDSKDQSYLLYLYPYTQNGSIFSDMSNWRNFFREEQQQLRVSLFDIKQVLIPVEVAKLILANIASHIPLTSAQ